MGVSFALVILAVGVSGFEFWGFGVTLLGANEGRWLSSFCKGKEVDEESEDGLFIVFGGV